MEWSGYKEVQGVNMEDVRLVVGVCPSCGSKRPKHVAGCGLVSLMRAKEYLGAALAVIDNEIESTDEFLERVRATYPSLDEYELGEFCVKMRDDFLRSQAARAEKIERLSNRLGKLSSEEIDEILRKLEEID